MAVRPILKMGNPLLLQPAEPVTAFGTAALQALIDDMRDTMNAHQGAGLAAPQIGISLQVVIFGGKNNSRYPNAEEIPETILINPMLTVMSSTLEESWEGCLSVPGLRGLVPRYLEVRYQGFDLEGNVIDRTVNGFHARVVQHECDHLFGMLYPQRLRNPALFGFEDELRAAGIAGPTLEE